MEVGPASYVPRSSRRAPTFPNPHQVNPCLELPRTASCFVTPTLQQQFPTPAPSAKSRRPLLSFRWQTHPGDACSIDTALTLLQRYSYPPWGRHSSTHRRWESCSNLDQIFLPAFKTLLVRTLESIGSQHSCTAFSDSTSLVWPLRCDSDSSWGIAG